MFKKLSARSFTSDIAFLFYIAAATTICHLLVAGNYGYFIDELYTLACSNHLSLAFVDIPPVAPTLLALSTAVFGDSLTALHILPSLFSGAVVLIVGLMAKELGGGKRAVILSGLCAAFVPVWMTLGSLYTYDFLDQLNILLLFYFVIRMLKRENPKLWIAVGVMAGLGVMTKPSMVFFVLGVAIGLLFTKHRKMYLTRWPWLGAAAALVILSPAIIWQAVHGFPIASYWIQYSVQQAVHVNPAEFVMMQVVTSNVALLPVWLTGLCWFLFGKEGKKYRLLGVIFCVMFVLFMFTGAKPYMPAPLYGMLIAGGAVALEKFAGAKKRRKVFAAAYACLAVLLSLAQSPVFMPVLPVDTLVKYYDAVGGAFGMKSVKLGNYAQNDMLPQYMYDRFDWDVFVRDVADVYNSLPEEERKDVTIYTWYYGCGGAIDLMGGKYGLPKVVCSSLNYAYFSVDNIKEGTWIAMEVSKDVLDERFESVELAKVSVSQYRQPHETAIYICRGPKFNLEQAREFIMPD